MSSASRPTMSSSAAQGRRSSKNRMITAASMISRSASGSAIFPKFDSTCQRRASQPSSWSVIPAAAKISAAGQLFPSSAVTSTTTKTWMATSRSTVSAFGSWARRGEIAGAATRGSYLSIVGSDGGEKDVRYSQLLRLAHDAPRQIERVELSGERTAVAVLRDGSRLRAHYSHSESVTDLETLLRRAGVELVRE